VLTFKRAVLVDTWADLKIGLEAKAVKAASAGVRVLILAGTMMLLAVFGWIRQIRPGSPAWTTKH
jgi:hypothetical protein